MTEICSICKRRLKERKNNVLLECILEEGVSIKEAAQMCDVSYATIHRVLNGQNVTERTMKKIASQFPEAYHFI